MHQKAKLPRRWPWYLAIGGLTLLFVFAVQSVAIGLTSMEACSKLELISVSTAMACKWRVWTDPAVWVNWRLMWIGVVVGICVGLALWNAAVLSRYGLGGRSRDAHSISAEYRPIVLGLVGFTLLALFVNLTNILAGV